MKIELPCGINDVILCKSQKSKGLVEYVVKKINIRDSGVTFVVQGENKNYHTPWATVKLETYGKTWWVKDDLTFGESGWSPQSRYQNYIDEEQTRMLSNMDGLELGDLD